MESGWSRGGVRWIRNGVGVKSEWSLGGDGAESAYRCDLSTIL